MIKMLKRQRAATIDEEPEVLSHNTKARKIECDSNLAELTHNDYTVGWVCALPKEQTAARAMLDQLHPDLPKPSNDNNTYTLGSIRNHNIVIACLPKGRYGTVSAATVAAWMVGTFPSIKIGLMVGIGGGIPPKVRLGDVVVSVPVDQYPGVVQWDFGKTEAGGKFKRIGALNNPPSALLTALTKLETAHEMSESKIPEYLQELGEKWPKLAMKYLRSEGLKDVLFKSDYEHIDSDPTEDEEIDEEEEETCQLCDNAMVVRRKPRDMMRVHYGLIASGNQVIKSATLRDQINKELNKRVLCVDMEAAGLMGNFPCIVIRGICDYADSHKNKDWQEHAAAVAAAFAKELLQFIQANDIEGERTAKDILDQVENTLSEIKNDVSVLSRQAAVDEKTEILNWLTPVNYGHQQSDFFSRRQEGTGKWLLDSAEFHSWLDQNGEILFCPGIPGAGKTVMTSIVIHDLETRFRTRQDVGIAYLYCNYRQKLTRSEVYANLLKQLSRRPIITEDLRKLYQHHRDKQTRPSVEELFQRLKSTVSSYERVFIIIDALDECEIVDGGRTGFLNEILNFQNDTRANLLVTSRNNQEISELFHQSVLLEIRARDEDVQRYLDSHISQLPTFVLSNPDLQLQIKTVISEAVNGMFLLAALHIDALTNQPTIGDMKQGLQDLPKGVFETYEQAMKRIENQGEGFRNIAKKALSWIIYATRTLSTAELQHALATKHGDTALNKDFIPEIGIIVSACAGLITVGVDSDAVRLVHYTAQEYFQRTSWFPQANDDLATTCISYLSFEVFNSGACQTQELIYERLEANKLYEYAAKNWGHHVHRASINEDVVIRFLENEAIASASAQAMMLSDLYFNTGPLMKGIHIATYFGLNSQLVLSILRNDNDINSKGVGERTALQYAAQGGHEALVHLLLDRGADIESRDVTDQTPLSHAVERGHEAVVHLLLDRGADIESRDVTDQTPLSHAVERGHEAVVHLLLDRGADIESKDDRGQTPLVQAVVRGREAIIHLLLDKGANIESEDSWGRTPLIYAGALGHDAVVRLLLEKRADINAEDKLGRTSLSHAAGRGYEAIVRLLLKGGADINFEDGSGRIPLSYATENGHEAVVKLLLKEKSVDLECQV